VTCTLVWFIPFIILFPLPLLKWLWQVSMFHIHTCIESTSTILTLPYPLCSPSPSWCYPPLSMTALHSCSSLFKCLLIVQWAFVLVFYL
jgi:hypothetical protein